MFTGNMVMGICVVIVVGSLIPQFSKRGIRAIVVWSDPLLRIVYFLALLGCVSLLVSINTMEAFISCIRCFLVVPFLVLAHC